MRTHKLGVTPPKRGWHQRFVAPKRQEADLVRQPKAERARSSKAMLYFVTFKGSRRAEPLIRYSHEPMAHLLEADPDILHWNAEEGMLEDGSSSRFSFRAQTRSGTLFLGIRDGKSSFRLRKTDADVPVRSRFAGNGVETWTQSQLLSHPGLAAAEQIHYHRSRELPDAVPFLVATMAAERPFRDLGDMQSRLADVLSDWEDILALIGQGYVSVRLDGPVGPGSPVLAVDALGHTP